RGKRDEVVIATKVGVEMSPDQKGLSGPYILRAVEASLRRLQTDYIDLYQSHVDDPETPQEETLEAYAQLIREGKVRAIGASNFTGERLESALQIAEQRGLPAYTCVQPHYNLMERREFEQGVAIVAQRRELGVIPYFALASGFLTGKYRSEADLGDRPRGQGVRKYLDGRGLRVLAALDEVSAQYDATPAQIAIAWLLGRPWVTAPIASATSMDQLDQLLRGAQIRLSESAIERLNLASAF
ncbi:MAG TPA: aldo/keto reductase, partial [Chthonomonadales bacterium]|nr:aldo/keto reductase [Chthonomonadales bacterium]